MSKFKVGDRVRILDGSTIKNYAGGWYTNMKKYVDTITTIRYVYKTCSGKIGYACHDTGDYIFDGRGLERCENETIVIYRKDNEVIALDKRTGKKAIAKCSPEDKFDFNIGAKLAFDRLMNGNKESTIVDDAYGYARYGHHPGEALYNHEYVVLEGYKPDKHSETKEPHKFKVGDIVKGNSESDRRYNITNSNMTSGKITEVSEDGKFIDVEMLEHKYGDSGNFYGLESKYFDLVEETPKLYNGKIIFTKGDEIFKTGHIYEVKDGIIHRCDGSFPTGDPLKDIEDVKNYFTGNRDGNRKRKKGWSACTLELMEVKED